MIRFGPDVCANVVEGTAREWLETNGLGGFASGTISGIHTRRYHGLLTAALEQPAGRFLLLSKLEETVIVNNRRYELSANRYPGAIHPAGFHFLRQFRLDPFPVWVYTIDGVEIEKSAFLVRGENTVVVQYEVRGNGAAELEVRPLIAFRDCHATTHENPALDGRVEVAEGVAAVAPYAGMPALFIAHDAASLDASGDWYRNFEYDLEHERGLDYREDLYQPFALRFDLAGRDSAAIIASTERHAAAEAGALRDQEQRRRKRIAAPFACRDRLSRALAEAAEAYFIRRGGRCALVAGYHWFGEWGRDAMIALPGLALVTGRAQDAREILLAYLESCDQGLIPNRFAESGGPPEYNTVDASLWLFEAVRKLLEYTGDYAFVREKLYAGMQGMLEWHSRGTYFGIRADSDGLLEAGAPGLQLTWMDARVGDWVVTPRRGKPVEVQALWYNALRVMEQLAGRFGDPAAAERWAGAAARAAASFNQKFWNEEAGCLFDVVAGEARDASLRPNQVIAAGVPHIMISRERALRVLQVVRRELLTPFGLRTLAPGDPRYRGRMTGPAGVRDAAYHQGTVWPWLMGPFLTAWLSAHGRTDQARAQVRQWLEPFLEHLETAGLGHISECFDGDAPHQPRGAIAQAWSVGELLRVAAEAFAGVGRAAARPTLPASEGRRQNWGG